MSDWNTTIVTQADSFSRRRRHESLTLLNMLSALFSARAWHFPLKKLANFFGNIFKRKSDLMGWWLKCACDVWKKIFSYGFIDFSPEFFFVIQVREFKFFRKSQGHKSLASRPTLTNSLINWMEKFPGKRRSQQHLVTLVKFPAAVDIIRHPKLVQKEILTLINLTFKKQVSPRHRNLLKRHASLVEVELDILRISRELRRRLRMMVLLTQVFKNSSEWN